MKRAVLTVLALALLAPAVASAQVRVGPLTIQRFQVETGRLVAYGLEDGAPVRVPVARITVTCSRARLELEQASAPLVLHGSFCGRGRPSIVAQLNALVR